MFCNNESVDGNNLLTLSDSSINLFSLLNKIFYYLGLFLVEIKYLLVNDLLSESSDNIFNLSLSLEVKSEFNDCVFGVFE